MNYRPVVLSFGKLAEAGEVWSKHIHEMGCPMCGQQGEQYLHLENPYLVAGQDDYKAWIGRGDMIVVPMWCEQGHKFDLCFGFHKGQVYVFVQNERLESDPNESEF